MIDAECRAEEDRVEQDGAHVAGFERQRNAPSENVSFERGILSMSATGKRDSPTKYA